LKRDLLILRSFWTPLSQISQNKSSRLWKIIHPYAKHLGYEEQAEEIEVSILGHFIDEVPSGLCAVAYQHLSEDSGELDPTHPLSFTGLCIFSSSGDGRRSLISDCPATFYRGDSYI
jgi:hypothetical protein